MDNTPLTEALLDVKNTARDQLAAAWQLQIERIQEQLTTGWREHIEQVFDERFAEISERVEAEAQKAVEDRVRGEQAAIRRAVSDQLNQIVRRLRQAEDTGQLWSALLDGALNFCERAAVFTIKSRWARCEVARGFADDAGLVGKEFALAFAPAFESAVESRETTIAMCSPREISETLVHLIGAPAEDKICLFPAGNRTRVAAVLYVDHPIEIGALELLASAAGYEEAGRVEASQAVAAGLVAIGVASPATASVSVPDWAALSPADQDLHLRAQRFARVQVAEIRLYKAQAVKTGRLARDLYGALQSEIDLARETFRRQFLAATPTMVDYLHREVVRTLANDDVATLGPQYPGPLV